MSSLAEQIYEETKTLADDQARSVLDFIGYLKRKGDRSEQPVPASKGADADWDEFEQLAGAWSGKFDRESCFDRAILR